jgi:hypothetical protein
MPITIIPDTGVNNIYVNADTGRNIILSGIGDSQNFYVSGIETPAPHNQLAGLQGGQAGQYYHLTADEYANLNTGIDSSLFYPTSNPSGFITGVDLTAYVTGDVVRPSDTGQFYPTSNPSGYITGVDLTAYVTGEYVNITGNETISGQKTFVNTLNVSGIHYESFPTSPTHQEGLVFYSNEKKTLSFFNDRSGVEMNIGEELWGRAVNKTLSTLSNGTVVYVSGAQGQRPTIWPALASSSHADLVIGVTTEEILNNDEGYVTVFGSVRGLDLSSYLEGQVLYLSETTSGAFQSNKPIAPNHAVRVGYVVNNHHVNGTLLVSIHNGGELSDLHDVHISGVQNKDALLYNINSGIWENRPINTGDISGISNYYLNSNPSGFINSLDGAVLLTGSQQISGEKNFSATSIFSGGVRTSYRATSINTTFLLTDYTIHATSSCTVTLPTAVGIAGQIFEVKASNSCIVILEGDGSELIDEELNISINGPDSITVKSTGSGWIII